LTTFLIIGTSAIVGAMRALLLVTLVLAGCSPAAPHTSPAKAPPAPPDPQKLPPAEGARVWTEQYLAEARDKGGKEIKAVTGWQILDVKSHDYPEGLEVLSDLVLFNVTEVIVRVDYEGRSGEFLFRYHVRKDGSGRPYLVLDRVVHG
jgi:hypothetical protein